MDQLVTYVRGFSFGGMTYPKGGLFGPIQRPYLSLLEVTEGACTLVTPEAKVEVSAGHIGIAATASKFEFDYHRGQSTSARWCEGFLPELSQNDFAKLNQSYSPIATPDLLKNLMEIGIGLGNESSPSLNATRNALGLAAIRGFLHSTLQSERQNQLPKVVLKARHLLDEGIADETLNLSAVAAQCGVTQQYLITIFKKSVGTTPARYLWKMRLRRAREYLVHADKSQAVIAFDCGFKSLAHFSRSIKKQFGMTPAQLRKDAGYTRPSDEEDNVPDLHF